MQRPVVVVVTNSQPGTTKSTSAELYRCKRKAEREIGSQQSAWIQTMTVSQYLLSVAERREFRNVTANDEQICNDLSSSLSPTASREQPNRRQLSFIDVNAKLNAKLEASDRCGSRQ
ncbi:hypothetical protein MHU86_8827 [Fragilaria crotonensis]|nr:hypothetical protein MHU86_8827 [Fragilaria crotonensis]